ncbi:LuxR C-terminal-related transcriptional regulator [Hafnia paralvei]
MAKDFNCSTKTVYAHKYHILEKLGFSSINHLILFLNNTENYKNIGKPLQ